VGLRDRGAPAFLLAGLFPWQWMANTLTAAPGCFLRDAVLIKKVAFPRYALVLSGVFQDAVHFAVSLPVLALILLALGRPPSLWWLAGVPLFFVLQTALAAGTSLLLSSINAHFRDLERLTAMGLTFLFYLSPVLYAAERVPERWRPFYFLNPAAGLVEGWRAVLLDGRIDLAAAAWGAAHAAAFLAAGLLAYRRLEPGLAEVL
jgi:lipopolysaccharide transport system permease protein